MSKESPVSLLRGTRLLNIQICFDTDIEATPFNADANLRSHQGLFFEIEAENESITIQTLEVDVRTGLGNNLQVDVYTSDAPVVDAHDTKDRWTVVAKSTLVVNPKGGASGAIIPAFDFSPIEIPANERRSLYVRMRGPYLDASTNSFVGAPGEEALALSDMTIYAGYGVSATDAEFPELLRTSLAPIFAGRIHYKKQQSCNSNSNLELDSIDVEFSSVFDRAINTNDFLNINQGVTSAINTLLRSNDDLASLVSEHGLTLGAAGVTSFLREYTAPCPWPLCTAVVTNIPLQYSNKLREGDVKEIFYSQSDSISQAMLGGMESGTQGAYVGLSSSEACLNVRMVGVSETDTMDTIQQEYFGERVVTVAAEELPSGLAQTFSSTVTRQQLFPGKGIDVELVVNGAILSTFSASDFAGRIQSVLSSNSEQMVADLKFYQLYPGPMSEDSRANFFGALESFEVRTCDDVDFSNGAGGSSSGGQGGGGSGGPPFGIIIGAVIGALALIVCCFIGFKYAIDRSDKAEERRIEEDARKRKASQAPNPEQAPLDGDFNNSIPRRIGEDTNIELPEDGPFFEDEGGVDDLSTLGGSTIITDTIQSHPNSQSGRRFSLFNMPFVGGDNGSARKVPEKGNRRASTGVLRGSKENVGGSDLLPSFAARRRGSTGSFDSDDDVFHPHHTNPVISRSQNFGNTSYNPAIAAMQERRTQNRRASTGSNDGGRHSGEYSDLYYDSGSGQPRGTRKHNRRASTGSSDEEEDFGAFHSSKRKAPRRASTGSTDGSDDGMTNQRKGFNDSIQPTSHKKSVIESTLSSSKHGSSRHSKRGSGRGSELGGSSKHSRRHSSRKGMESGSSHSITSKNAKRRSSHRRSHDNVDESESGYSFGSSSHSLGSGSEGHDNAEKPLSKKVSKKAKKAKKKKKSRKSSTKEEKDVGGSQPNLKMKEDP